MVDVKEALTGKLGPAPVWVWAAGVSVPLIAWRLIAAHRAAAAAAAAATADQTTTDGALNTAPDSSTLTSSTGSVAAGALYPTGNPGGIWSIDQAGAVGTTPTGPVDNYAWINAAADRLVSQGYSPAVVLSALRKVIDGQPISDQEEAIFNLAVRASGNPPGGIPTISRAAATTTATTPTTPTGPAPIDQAAAAATETQRVADQAAYNDRVNAQLAATAAADRAAGVTVGTPYTAVAQAPTVAPVTAAPAPATVTAAGANTATVAAGETMYSLIHRVTGSYPSVAEVKRVAALNGLTVGKAPAYQVTPWHAGQVIRLT